MRLSGRTRLWKPLELWKTTRRVFHEFQQCSTALTTKFSASPKIQKPKQITRDANLRYLYHRIKKEERKELSISLFFYIGVSGSFFRKIPIWLLCYLVHEICEYDFAFGEAENLVVRAVETRVKVE